MKQLRRSKTNEMFGGVMGGLADYTGIDVSILRIAYVLLSIFSVAFPGILVYIIAWMCIPVED